jgi:hypothetical protein
MIYNHFYNNLSASILILLMLLHLEPGFCQGNQNLKQNSQKKSQAITAEQTLQIKQILSIYYASKLTADEAKAIQNKFREAGIHAGPETNDAITAAGFDPEKLRKMAPPPNSENKVKSGPPSIDERLKIIDEKICSPLSLSTVQKETVNKAFRDFYTEMDKLVKSRASVQMPLDKSKVEPLEKTRDAKIKQVISDEQFIKYMELEKVARPNRKEKSSESRTN